MHGRPLLIVLALLTVGCVTPAADLQTASIVGGLQALTTALPEFALTTLPNGDLEFVLQGEFDTASQMFTYTVPAGTTFVEALLTTENTPISVVTFNDETSAAVCYPRTWTGWQQLSRTEASCAAIAASDPGATWTTRISRNVGGDLLSIVPDTPMTATARPAPTPFTLTLTFSALPLDGGSAPIKLDALSKPVYDALEIEFVKVPASADGAGLHVEVTRPKTDEKVPVIFRASPYNGPSQNANGRSAGSFVDHWVARGYAAAVMDLRGTGKSDGCFAMRALIDQTDVADVVEWLGTQDWSNGKVGMHGISYEGFTPAAAAVQAPEHLAAIFIGAPAIDTWSNYLPGGVQTGRSISTVASYTTGNAALTPADELPPDSVLHTVDAFCEPTIFPKGNDPRNLYDAWYAERNLTENVANIKAPVYYEHGFWDNNVKANAITDFFNALTVEKRGVFGSWQHIWALRADEQVRMLAWMDQWLKGIDTGILETPVMEVLTNTREWRSGDAWPPLDATYVDFAVEGADFAAEPAAVGGLPVGVFPTSVSRDFDIGDKLYLSGVPVIDMQVGILNGGNAHIEARLYEIPAEGDPIFAGVGWMNLAHRNGHDTFAPFAPGEVADVQLKLLPQDHVFQPGSTLRIELRSVTEDWGGPETGVGATPALVHLESATLRLPTLPYAVLGPSPRSAS